jgi:L-fuculose-phosphate aldolase
VPEARAVIHCHPPYATAHAIAGIAPKGNFLPEQEVFVGPVAVAPYETPGTQAFAETVIPLARDHNTILLRNHGIVCWADTVTHAEWYVEVVETYCKTMMIASQLGGTSLKEIPPAKLAELLAIKKKMGLPDPRIGKDPNEREALPPYPAELSASQPSPGIQREIDRLVAEFTEKISSLVDRSA